MAKTKYHYTPATLKYEKVEKTIKVYMINFFYWLCGAIIFFSIGFFVAINFVDSPFTKNLKRQINDLTYNYTLLRMRIDNMNKVLESLRDKDNNIYRVIFETDPISSDALKPNFLDVKQYDEISSSKYYSLIVETSTRLDSLAKSMYVQSKSYDFLIKEVKSKDKMMRSIPAIQPIANKNLKRVASGYGYRVHPIYKTLKFHSGMDFSAPTGTSIYATGDGVLIKAGKVRGYGNTVLIDHGYGYKRLYGHRSKIIARAGRSVKRGQVIGDVGSTGQSTGPHLHYEVRKNNHPVKTIDYYFKDLTPEEYEKILIISSKYNQSND
ncbi:MAG: M23 family metallopeptidase [Solitalea-like symbiont of Acarus siro]